MDKAFVKRVVSIVTDISSLNDIDDIYHSESLNYITGVKYVIFLISKFLFICKINENKSLNYALSSNVSNNDIMGILNEYSIFDLHNLEIEEKVFNLMNDFKNTISHKNFIPAKLYELLLTPKEKKILGQVYTPFHIVESMLFKTYETKKINRNMKILDPSCGGGYFLIEAFKKIREEAIHKSLNISDKYIMESMIYGVDIDNFSIFLTKMGLLFNSCLTNAKFNIINTDFLTGYVDSDVSFDIIIGNPPYIGHKQIEKEYKHLLKNRYPEVFYDKSDISYCFFKRGKELLKVNGLLCLITSRYFMEAMYADKLRNYIKNSFSIVSIVDYNGYKVFKGAMISPAIITLSNKNLNKNMFLYVKYNVDNLKIDNFSYEQTKLSNKGWIILNETEEQLFHRIENQCNTYIRNVCNIKQGIITGLDKAFIVSDDEIEKYQLENSLLKKWIKNSNISKTNISYKNLYLIYTNMIENEEEYPNTIKYLQSYKDILINRRECKKGFRKWYELQWGRVQTDFESQKILFPYKSDSNNFCFDKGEYYCSADVYFINELHANLSFEYLQNYLNSNIFEFYFKCHAKKVGVNLFEYYPNKLNFMKIYLPDEKLGKNIYNLGKISIDNFLEKVFNISVREKAIINKYITKKGDDAK